MNLDLEAMLFAQECHKNQKRKYTNEPYFLHLAQVVGLISSTYDSDDVLATAWLHDCMEDCDISYDNLKNKFGEHIADGVKLLSDLEKGNRAWRKYLSRERLREAPPWVQDIKVCDIISNTPSIIIHDPKFAKIYIEEVRLLLDVLTEADNILLEIARLQIDNIENENI